MKKTCNFVELVELYQKRNPKLDVAWWVLDPARSFRHRSYVCRQNIFEIAEYFKDFYHRFGHFVFTRWSKFLSSILTYCSEEAVGLFRTILNSFGSDGVLSYAIQPCVDGIRLCGTHNRTWKASYWWILVFCRPFSLKMPSLVQSTSSANAGFSARCSKNQQQNVFRFSASTGRSFWTTCRWWGRNSIVFLRVEWIVARKTHHTKNRRFRLLR